MNTRVVVHAMLWTITGLFLIVVLPTTVALIVALTAACVLLHFAGPGELR